MRMKLRDNGKLFLYVPANMILWTKLDDIVGHYRRYDKDSLKKFAKMLVLKLKNLLCRFIRFFITIMWKLFKIFQ